MPLSENDLPDLINDLNQVADNWMTLGVKLGMKTGTLKTVQKNYPNDQEQCLLHMLTRLIKKKEVQWRDITNALRSLDEGVLATNLEKKYRSRRKRSKQFQEDKLELEESFDGGLGMFCTVPEL